MIVNTKVGISDLKECLWLLQKEKQDLMKEYASWYDDKRFIDIEKINLFIETIKNIWGFFLT